MTTQKSFTEGKWRGIKNGIKTAPVDIEGYLGIRKAVIIRWFLI